ncbi:SLATT domain-containing protein [Vibrio breoganii]
MAFSDDIWWTRKARIQTEKRLLSSAHQSQLLLLWYSFSAVAVSIYYLKFASADNDFAGVAWVIYSILPLTMSGYLAGRSFKERSSQIKECYEALKSVEQKVKKLESLPVGAATQEDWESIREEYRVLLGLCENHTDSDMTKALCLEHLTTPGKADKNTSLKPNMTKCPTLYHWFVFIRDIIKQLIALFIMYTLPIIIFIYLESTNGCATAV